jgi:hypothetical protein
MPLEGAIDDNCARVLAGGILPDDQSRSQDASGWNCQQAKLGESHPLLLPRPGPPANGRAPVAAARWREHHI